MLWNREGSGLYSGKVETLGEDDDDDDDAKALRKVLRERKGWNPRDPIGIRYFSSAGKPPSVTIISSIPQFIVQFKLLPHCRTFLKWPRNPLSAPQPCW